MGTPLILLRKINLEKSNQNISLVLHILLAILNKKFLVFRCERGSIEYLFACLIGLLPEGRKVDI